MRASRQRSVIHAVLVTGLLIALYSTLHASEIHDAVRARDPEALKALLTRDPSLVQARDGDQKTPLHLAAWDDDAEIVTLLIAHGADLNARHSINKSTPLHYAKEPAVARLLIQAGADLRAENSSGRTPLKHAVSTGDLDLIDVYLEAGEKLDFESLVELGRTEEVAAMLEEKPWLAKPPSDALLTAAEDGNVELVRLLLAHGADPNHEPGHSNIPDPYTPLSGAVTYNHFEIAKLLFLHGADPNVSGGRNHDHLFLFAIAYLEPSFVHLMLEHGPDLRQTDSWGSGSTPLHIAAALGGAKVAEHSMRVGQPHKLAIGDPQVIEKVNLLLEHGADVNARTEDGTTPLLFAAAAGNSEVCELLLDKGASLDFYSACTLGRRTDVAKMLDSDPELATKAEGPLGRSPLHWAAMHDDPALITFLLSKGAGVNFEAPRFVYHDAGGFMGYWEENERGETPLHVASRHGHNAAVRSLVGAGADLEARNNEGRTPLMVASGAHRIETVRLLLEEGSAVNAAAKDGYTAIHDAIENREIVELLLDAGADMNGGPDGRKPVQAALDWDDSVEIAELLYTRGAALDILSACTMNKPEAVRRILEKDRSQLEANSRQRDRPICIAAEHGALDVVRLLLEQGASIEPGESWWESPLHLAAGEGHADVVRLLLDRGLPVDIRAKAFPYYYGNKRRTALHHAALCAQPEMVKLLIERGADQAAADAAGNTPLHLISDWNGYVTIWKNKVSPELLRSEHQVAELLLDAGSDVNARDKKGQTPLHSAAVRGQEDLADLLIQNGAEINTRDDSGRTVLKSAEREKQRRDERARLRWRGYDVDHDRGISPVLSLLREHGGVK